MAWGQSDISVKDLSTRNSGDYRIRAGAKAKITTEEMVLLVRERHDDGSSFWTLPGGGVASEESLTAGLRREVREELESDVVLNKPVNTVWYAHRGQPHTLTLYYVFRCDLLSEPQPNLREGVSEYRWWPKEGLPAETLPQIRFL